MPTTHDAHLQRWRDRLTRRSNRCFRLRLLLAAALVIALLLPWSAWARGSAGAVIIVGFVVVAVLHARIDRGLRRCDALLRVQRQQRARVALDWSELPAAVRPVVPDGHSFAGDLDLFGDSGLHRLLDVSVSREGSLHLAAWLLEETRDARDIRARQQQVRSLLPFAHFRERLLMELALVSREKLDGGAFSAWLAKAALPTTLRAVLLAAALLALVNATLFVLYGMNLLPPYFLFGLLAYAALYIRNAGIRESFIELAIGLDAELGRLASVFRFLERYPLRGRGALAPLLEEFRGDTRRPSRAIRAVRRVVLAAGLSMNPVMTVLLNIALPWDLFFAWRLERHRRSLAADVPRWLEALHTLEALQSLANHAALHADAVFPHILEPADNAPLLEAEALGHPLIPAGRRVCNDVRIAKGPDILLITGSNMSGKSTMLRTLGIAAVLANVGGAVPARSFALRPVRLFTCINISDSLRDGVSYFYAEVRRLRRLLDVLREEKERGVLFLVDEMFRGTNTRERHAGGEAYIRELHALGATGLLSTHDIELTRVAEGLSGVRNLHFREHVEQGEMHFDYTLREGPCPTTNALTIMRLAGLPT